jgi:hypothetical protein
MMTQRETSRWSVVALALAGWASGCASLCSLHYVFYLAPLIPLVFGLAIAVCLRRFWGVRQFGRLSLFLATSLVFYYVAFFLSFYAAALTSNFKLGSASPAKIHAIAFFPGSFLGAFGIFIASLFLVSPGTQSESALKKSALFSLGSGLSGVLGWALGPSLGRLVWFTLDRWHLTEKAQTSEIASANLTFNLYSLYLVWQVGTALLLGLCLWQEQQRTVFSGTQDELESTAVAPPKPLSRSARRFFAGVVTLIGLWAISAVASIFLNPIRDRQAAKEAELRKQEIDRFIAEAPAIENLPETEVLPVDQVIITSKIAGYQTSHPSMAKQPAGRNRVGIPVMMPERLWYYAAYAEPSEGDRSPPTAAMITVTKYPNSDWANYAARADAAYVPDSERGEKDKRFGNLVFCDSHDMYVHWPSGNTVVFLRLYSWRKGEFIKAYLAKYPSSLN